MTKQNDSIKKVAYKEISRIGDIVCLRSDYYQTMLFNKETQEVILEHEHGFVDHYKGAGYYVITSSAVANDSQGVYITIYDAINKKFLARDWQLVSDMLYASQTMALKSPIDGKIHLFDVDTARKEQLFEEAYDEIKVGSIIILKKDTAYEFICLDPFKKSDIYDAIKVRPRHDYIDGITLLYGIGRSYIDSKTGQKVYYDGKDTVDAYDIDDKLVKFLFRVSSLDVANLEFLSRTETELLFLNKCKNKFGLISIPICQSDTPSVVEPKELLSPIYDEISEEEERNIYLSKQKDKYGLFKFGEDYIYSVPVNYDYQGIVHIFGAIYALYDENDMCEIVNMNDGTRIKGVTPYSYKVINENVAFWYEKSDGYHLALIGVNSSLVLYGPFDNIICLKDRLVEDFYILEKDGQKNMIDRDGCEVFMEDYDEINYKITNFYHASFALKKGEKYKFAHFLEQKGIVYPLENREFEDITFYKDIVVLKDSNEKLIFNNRGEFIRAVPSDTEITEVKSPDERGNSFIYQMNGVYYSVVGTMLMEVTVYDGKVYITTYESESASYRVISLDGMRHDSLCKKIDSEKSEEANQTLETLAREDSKGRGKVMVQKVDKTKKDCK